MDEHGNTWPREIDWERLIDCLAEQGAVCHACYDAIRMAVGALQTPPQ